MNDTSFPLVDSSPQNWRRQAERELLSRELIGSFRRICYLASKLHDITPTRAARANLAAISVSFDRHIREELQQQERGHR